VDTETASWASATAADTGRAYANVASSPRYAPLWLAQLVSNFGDTIHYVALVVLVFGLTGSGLAVATLVAAEVVPVLLLAPVAGVVIDRFSRKGVLIGADLFRAVLVLSLVWPRGAWHAYLVAAGLAVGSAFFNPTARAVIPALTTEEQRLAANSVAWSTGRLVQIAGAAVAGGLVGVVGTGAAFGLNAATFVASALLLARLPIPRHAGGLGGGAKRGLGGYLAEARAGLAFARRDRLVSRLLVVQSLASLAVGATGAMLVVLAERHLRLAPSGFTWLIGSDRRRGARRAADPEPARQGLSGRPLAVRALRGPGVGDALLATVASFPAALAILVAYGLNTSTGMVVFASTVQGAVPDRVRGRVFTLLDASWNAALLLSLALGGLIVEAFGVRALYWLGSALLALAGGLGLALLGGHDFRREPEPEPAAPGGAT
jgi:MFS family permease